MRKTIVEIVLIAFLFIINVNILVNGSSITTDPIPDLDCSPSLTYYGVILGTTVYNTFEVKNIGDPGSTLDWAIQSYPDWGTWEFSPMSGENLKPEDGTETINVTVIVPHSQISFVGNITLVNTENSSDYCVVHINLDGNGPKVRITKPSRAIYKDNNALFPFIVPVIIGDIDITVSSTDTIWRVDFSIDSTVKYTDTTEPFQWTWNETGFFSHHTIQTTIYGKGYTKIATMKVWKIR